MLIPAPWLPEDPKFNAEWQLPMRWQPPDCTDDAFLPPADPVDHHIHEGCDCAKNAGLLVR